uniref:NEDD8-activating enzyme E1 catalytic subunit n=1 Tax=Hucho hucho TaxID=62062 RepID=A0A4W5KUE3_9TELE
MAVDGGDSRDWDGRWNHVKKFLERPGPFTHPDFEPSTESPGFLLETCKILVIGAGGLGSELLKNLALSDFHHIHGSSFSGLAFVGRPKADVAADFVNSRVPGCQVVPHFNKIQDFDESFYRRKCRLCVHYGSGSCLSLRWCWFGWVNPEHIQWVFQRAQERAAVYSITGVTYRLTQGVVKRIIPAVASTNAVIAAACSTEVFKIVSNTYIPLNNYLVFNIVDGLYTYTFEENCSACSQVPQDLQFPPSAKLQEVLEYLTENASLQMKSPSITATLEGKHKTLYLQTVASIEERTRPNLCKTLKELGLSDGQELAVADVTTPHCPLQAETHLLKG